MNSTRIPKIMLDYRSKGWRRLRRPWKGLLDEAETGLSRSKSWRMMMMMMMIVNKRNIAWTYCFCHARYDVPEETPGHHHNYVRTIGAVTESFKRSLVAFQLGRIADAIELQTTGRTGYVLRWNTTTVIIIIIIIIIIIAVIKVPIL